ncbi:hypothetical protein PGTUg99_016140 [Puccinia graminis f. sp. tritici]|uniref:Uncharacterized protein n=2 Tax=Puccinia graminis f. sp. tritici TaxID=56615 RepID=A0A5B0PD72_PUCGR|nr:hypothetical protein PGTUg99_016140 [Puccinia graminis f. sp. tritici]
MTRNLKLNWQWTHKKTKQQPTTTTTKQEMSQQPTNNGTTTGGFKLKLKLNGPPPPPQQQQQQQQQQYHHHQTNRYPEEDEQEDQLASSEVDDDEEEDEQEDGEEEDGLEGEEHEGFEEDLSRNHQAEQQENSFATLPPHHHHQPAATQQPVTKRPPKSKNPPPSNNPQPVAPANPPAKKRKTNSQPIAIHPQRGHHLTTDQDGPDSEMSSYTSDQPHQAAPRSRTIKITHPSINPKSKSKTNLVPLSDAELLSAAAGPQYPPQDSSAGVVSGKSKAASSAVTGLKTNPPKKKQANSEGSKKRAISNNPSTTTAPHSNPPAVPNQPATGAAAKAPAGSGTKSKAKKGSKLSQAKTQDPFQPTPVPSGVTTPILRPPPGPRPQHDYSLGPPPPPPVPALKPFPVGPPPRAQGQFLPAQVLEKRTPRVRSWKKIRREVVGISGIPFWIWTYAGDEHSDYAIAKQHQLSQAVGTPSLHLSNQETTQYFPSGQPSRPASVASSHAKPSPMRNPSGTSRAKYVPAEPSSGNLGGPILPASFRRPPMSIGSPLNGKPAEALGSKKPTSSQLDPVSRAR